MADPARNLSSPVRPADAAGLVLIRAARNAEPEILLGRRHMRAGFLPDIYVVPGGRVDASDSRPSGFPESLAPGVATSLASGGSRRPALAFPRAALRETFEETGLLVGTAGTAARTPALPVWQAYAAARLVPDFAQLDFICRAITPVTSKRRYNTRFFLGDGALARGEVRGDGELEDLGWRPVSALSGLNIVDVTEYVLQEALRRWRARAEGNGHPAGIEPPKLLNYRKDIMTLSRHRARPG
ncbi:MAG TPA: NUDIX hydrolase [Candidatus Binatia bacterium]|nr:NUDIX hydrolase [Candidatus Binatia bacterium]